MRWVVDRPVGNVFLRAKGGPQQKWPNDPKERDESENSSQPCADRRRNIHTFCHCSDCGLSGGTLFLFVRVGASSG